jgi:translocating chain-associated membrane protein 1
LRMGVEVRRAAAARSKKGASPPIFSNEFIIQNHGDIMSCILMVIALGFFFQFSTPFSTLFVLPQYNESVQLPKDFEPQTYYRAGIWDWPAIFFYTIVWITAHCIIQEYFLDKIQRKLHMSKTRMSKFNESGQLAFFGLYSFIHSGTILYELGIHKDITGVWNGYPDIHRYMNMSTKFYFILHIAYWLHQFPEFYFQKVRKEDIPHRAFYSTIFLVLTTAAYFSGFVRVGALLLFLEGILLFVFHSSRALYFAEKTNTPLSGFKVWNVVFVVIRFISVVVSVLTFWYGFRSIEVPFVEPTKPNFNTTVVRINTLIVVLGLQFYNLWNFFTFHFGRFREKSVKIQDKKKNTAVKPTKKDKSKDSDSEGSKKQK